MVPIPEASAQALAFQQARTLLWLLEGVWGVSVLILLCGTGCSARMRDLAQRLSAKHPAFAVALFGALLAIVLSAWALPISWLKVLLRREYGLGDVTAAAWFGGEVTRMALHAALAAAFLWLPYWLLRRAGKRAWLYAGFGFAALILAMKVVGPLVIEPIMEPAGRIKDVRLEARLQELAREAGMEGVRIIESPEPGEIAEVRGIGPAVRIRLSSSVSRWSEDQVRYVVAHEMGHHVLGHLWQDAGLSLATILLSLLAAQRVGEYLARRFASRLGFASIADVASAPLLLALFTVASAIGTPLENALARQEEHEADVFALELTRNNRAAEEALLKAGYTKLSNPRPHPLLVALRQGHPALAERIEFAHAYRPWETGEPMRHPQLFRSARE